jgi:hypothetical protein
VNILMFEVNTDSIKNILDIINISSTVNIELDIVRVLSLVIEALVRSVIVITSPLSSVSVSIIKGTNILDAAIIGSTVNIELDIVRVLSPVIEALAGRVRVIKDSPGSISVCTIKDTNP